MKIEIEYGETANAGNFESIRIACRIEGTFDEFDNDKDLRNRENVLYKEAKRFVQSKIIKELKARNA